MNNNTFAHEIFNGFSGLGLSSARGQTSRRLDNFRVLADGSIQKREGIRQIADLQAEVRGIYAFVDGDEDVILAVAGNSLYRISATGEQVLFGPCFETDNGEISFFEYGGRLYMLDGVQVYRYEGGCEATRVRGYTPLYGKNWNPVYGYTNTVNEPINYFSPSVRIHFSVNETVEYLYVGMAIKEVEWVAVQGRLLSSSEYSMLSGIKDRIFLTMPLYDASVEICVTLEDRYYFDSSFNSSARAAVYEDFEHSRVFLYGGNNASALYISSPVGEDAQKRDKELFPDSCGLYFPKSQELSFGSGQPITAIRRIYDRMMIFFPSSLWVTQRLDEVQGDAVQFSPICHHMGCSAKNAVLLTGAASPISVTYGGIYRWRIDVDLLDECTAGQISGDIRPLLDDSFFQNAEVCHQRHRAELWFRDKSKTAGRIFIYSLDRDLWYCYSGIEADRMFAFGGGVGLVHGGKVFLFDEELTVDRFADGECEIKAVYESGWLEFDGVGTEKRLASATLTAELHGGELCVRFGEGAPLSEVKLLAANAVAPDIYEPRMPTGRFRAARLTFLADGAARQRIYRADLLAQKGKQ